MRRCKRPNGSWRWWKMDSCISTWSRRRITAGTYYSFFIRLIISNDEDSVSYVAVIMYWCANSKSKLNGKMIKVTLETSIERAMKICRDLCRGIGQRNERDECEWYMVGTETDAWGYHKQIHTTTKTEAKRRAQVDGCRSVGEDLVKMCGVEGMEKNG